MKRTYTAAGSATWTCPAGVHRVQSRCVGGGGAGGQRTSGNNSGAAGGRGGGFAAHHNLIVTPGTSYTIYVGDAGTAGGTPVDGKDSTFTVGGTVTLGRGGPSCASNSQTAPGAPAAGTGDIVFAGGAGGAGSGSGGGGGGGAGYTAVGGDASGGTAGTGVSPGANGATGVATTGTGAVGNKPGGGGAGGRRGNSGSQDGGGGGDGQVELRWLAPCSGLLLGVG